MIAQVLRHSCIIVSIDGVFIIDPLRRNIELKARCRDLAATAEKARALGARHAGELVQLDTYFNVPRGRLKLREIEGAGAELIAYQRPDTPDFRESTYQMLPVTNPALLRDMLQHTVGVRVQVRKRRQLWLWENVRIHLDQVEGLGSFLEFEAVVAPDEDGKSSSGRLATLAAALDVRDEDRIDVSYSDLMLQKEDRPTEVGRPV